MGQNPNRTPSEHPNPTTKIGSKMSGAPTPKWYHWFFTHSHISTLRICGACALKFFVLYLGSFHDFSRIPMRACVAYSTPSCDLRTLGHHLGVHAHPLWWFPTERGSVLRKWLARLAFTHLGDLQPCLLRVITMVLTHFLSSLPL